MGQVRPLLDAVALEACAFGFLSYEAAPAFDPAFQVRAGSPLPLAWFAAYDGPFHFYAELPDAQSGVAWRPEIDFAEYQRQFLEVRRALESGRSYQANLSLRLRSEDADPWAVFRAAAADAPPPYAAYVRWGDWAIASFSPELFFEKAGDRVTCRPMKGTSSAPGLESSVKDQAENLMITDMIRNDLSRVALPGTVTASALFAVEEFRTVRQMTSTVTASTEAAWPEVAAALFPCASIVGAPKVETTGLLTELEASPRGLYTGAIGLVGGGDAHFSVAIRTAVFLDTEAEYGVGGGIVWDSQCESEWAECALKARVLEVACEPWALLETMKLEHGEIALLTLHLDRLHRSARELGVPYDEGRILSDLQNQSGTARLRLLLRRDGSMVIETHALMNPPARLSAELAPGAVSSQDPTLRHKTNRRWRYDRLKQECEEVLLLNERQEPTEFLIGNLLVSLDGGLFTPPERVGLLPGVMRAHLLRQGLAVERDLSLQDLQRAEALYRCSSVSGIVPVDLNFDRSQQNCLVQPGANLRQNVSRHPHL